jgi:CRISPR-associated endonuclease/helicase Cas3
MNNMNHSQFFYIENKGRKMKNMSGEREVFYARKGQKLEEHLRAVADFSAKFSDFPNLSRLAGLLHDIGKATEAFQNYLNDGGIKGDVVHAFQGAIFASEIGLERTDKREASSDKIGVLSEGTGCGQTDKREALPEGTSCGQTDKRKALSEGTGCEQTDKRDALSEGTGCEQTDKRKALTGGIRVERTDIIAALLKEILEFVIIAHHGMLSDAVSPNGERVFYDKLDRKDGEEIHYAETLKNIERFADFNADGIGELFNAAKAEIASAVGKIRSVFSKSKESAYFATGFLVKYIYSCLVDADRLDAYLSKTGGVYAENKADWDALIATFEGELGGLPQANNIDKIRKEISDKCKDAADKETGIYQLSVPTGGGKTLSSLRFALHHAKKFHKKRIIYVIPYLSIIEQTANEFKKYLKPDENSGVLLEHHSNVAAPEDENEGKLRKLAVERWDNPIVITTMVRFLETVMSSKAGDLRKFHNMQDSVVIFDEIQSLPIKAVHCFNEAVSFLSKICGATVLLCSATQPLLGETERKNLLYDGEPNLIENTEKAFKELKRTVIKTETKKTADEFAAFVYGKAEANGDCLAIVNTKKTARKAYEKIKALNADKTFKVYHLSTAMCSAHRFAVFGEIKAALKNKEKIICVSTQLIEAGVDISFSCVVRSMAGLDSIAQAAGRCNRSGESGTKEVYAVPIDKEDENLDKLPDIRAGRAKSEQVIRENPDADYLDGKIMDIYYKYYFAVRENEMDFSVAKGGSVYEMLSTNVSGVKNFNNINGKDFNRRVVQAFASASENFAAIEQNTQSAVVPYGEAEELLKRYKSLSSKLPNELKEKINIIRKLQKFSVSFFEGEIISLFKLGALTIPDDEFGIMILDKNYYSEELGVTGTIDPEALNP